MSIETTITDPTYRKVIEGLPCWNDQLQYPRGLQFANQTALVVGGASGIGAATVKSFLAHGARVVIADIDVKAADEIRSSETKAVKENRLISIHTDVRELASCQNAVAACIAQTGRLDILIITAGIVIPDKHPFDEGDFDKIMAVNVKGTVNMIDAAQDQFISQRSGAIVTTGSVVASHGWPDRSMYCATKGAVEALTRSYALKLIPYGVKVNGVSPGLTWTPLMEKVVSNSPDPVEAFRERSACQASGTMLTPEEIADKFLFLAGTLSDGMVGVMLDVSGGKLIGHSADVTKLGPNYNRDFEASLKR
jgi:NAD(P)-dependent dehydrogenase (short-subunit alcohol dehydrogenase family)